MITTNKPNINYHGSPSCTRDNLDFFIIKLKELNETNTKLSFRQWIYQMITLLDLID